MVKRAKQPAATLPDLDDFFGDGPTASAPEATPAEPTAPPDAPATATTASRSTTCATSEPAASGGDSELSSDALIGLDEIMNPFTGEVVRVDDVDGLIGLYEGLDKVNKQAYAVLCRVREKLATHAEGDARTRRVRGVKRKAVLEFQSESFHQSDLKALWTEYDGESFREEVLKIDTIGVKLREYRKLINTSGDERFTEFRDKLTRACKGAVGLPTVKVEG